MIPPPDKTCHKCGTAFPYETVVCPVCGHGRRSNGTAIAIWALLLVLVGLPAGLLGGCFLLIGGSSGSSSTSAQTLAVGLLGVALPVFFLVMLIRAGRK